MTHEIVMFTCGCGATTSDSAQILLSSSYKSDTEAGNIMAFDEEEKVVVRWKDAKTVEISFPNEVKHLSKEPVVDGIQFQYKPE